MLLVAPVQMVSLAGFVVVPHHADAIGDKRQSVFEVMRAPPNRRRHPPHHKLLEHADRELVLAIKQQFRVRDGTAYITRPLM